MAEPSRGRGSVVSLSLQEGAAGGRLDAETDRQADAPSWVSGLAGLLGTCAHVCPGGCRREAGAAVARGRVRLCWNCSSVAGCGWGPG